MKKMALLLVMILGLSLNSCGFSVSQKKFVSLVSQCEKQIKSYDTLPKKESDFIYGITLFKESKEIFSYTFGITKYDNNSLRYNAWSRLSLNSEQNTYIYYLDDSTFVHRTYAQDSFHDTEEVAIRYEDFYTQHVSLKYHKVDLDFNEIKSYSFKDNHSLTPSADATIVFNEDYHFQWDYEGFLLDMYNLTAQISFEGGEGWQIQTIDLTGIDQEGLTYMIHWVFL